MADYHAFSQVLARELHYVGVGDGELGHGQEAIRWFCGVCCATFGVNAAVTVGGEVQLINWDSMDTLRFIRDRYMKHVKSEATTAQPNVPAVEDFDYLAMRLRELEEQRQMRWRREET